ncbi:MAG TPA: hypothetical protein ENK35_01815 [Candidatus Tenderia sp.]|nr:hypothetical protein [Candidatus Tenderia sp.]
MLSYVLRLAFEFQRTHSYWPNKLYLNAEHFSQWQQEFTEPEAFDEIARRLSLEIVISVDALHPHVAWLPGYHQIAR